MTWALLLCTHRQVRRMYEYAFYIAPYTRASRRTRAHTCTHILSPKTIVVYQTQPPKHCIAGLHVMESTFVAASRTRLSKSETCCAQLDDTTGSYVIVPVSFSSLGLFAGALGGHVLQCTVHSTETVAIEEVRVPPQLVGHAVIQQVMAKSKAPRVPIAVRSQLCCTLLARDRRTLTYMYTSMHMGSTGNMHRCATQHTRSRVPFCTRIHAA